MALYVIDNRYKFNSIYDSQSYKGNNPPNDVGVLWKVKDDQCRSFIINEYWKDKSKNYSICATRSNNLINPITDRLNGFPNAICSDIKGNIYVYANLEKTIQKIDINNNLSTVFTWPKFLDQTNNKDVGGFVNGKPYTTQDPVYYTNINSMAADDNENLYVALAGSFAIYKIDKNKNISKLCGQPSDTFLGPNEKANINWNTTPYKDGDKNSAVFQGGNEGPSRLKFFNNYLYVLDNREYQLRRIDLNGNVKTLLNWGQIIDYVITKNNILYIINSDFKLKKIDLNIILNSSDPKSMGIELATNMSYRVNVNKEYSTFGPDNGGQIFNFGQGITLDDKEENLYLSQRNFSYGGNPVIYKINLLTNENNPTIKAIAFAGENSEKRQGSILPSQGTDILTRDFNKNINLAFRIDKPEIISSLNVEYTYDQYVEYKIIAEGLPTKYSIAGNLPSGLIFENNIIFGNPIEVGEFFVLLRVEKIENNQTLFDSKVLNIKIKPKIISSLEVVGKSNQSLNYQIETEGTTTSYEAKLQNGQNLNTIGLSINQNTGLISGTLSSGGIFEIELKAKFNNIENTQILKIYSLDITSQTNITKFAGESFYYEITALGEPTSFEVLDLPPFLSFSNSLRKIISGILNVEAGQTLASITIKIKKDSIEYIKTLNISIGLRILNGDLSLEETLRHNQTYSLFIETDSNGNSIPGSVTISVQNLPPGLTFNNADNTISGTITNKFITGKYTSIITVTKNNITSQKNIIYKIPPIIAYNGEKIAVTIDKKFNYQINSPGAKVFIAKNLPPGLKIDYFKGIISGKCSAKSIGYYNSEISSSNEGGSTIINLLFYIGANFITKVFNKSIHNSFLNLGNPKTYSINEKESPVIYLEKGKSYIFDQSDSSNASNPLNIYFDEKKIKKLNKFISIKGTAGIDRFLTITIPKDFKETSTLYYMSENNDYVGGEIKIITKEYKLKHNIKLFCFGSCHDGQKYFIPNKLLSESSFLISGENSFIANQLGILALLSTPTGGDNFTTNLYNRKDTLNINLVKENGQIFDSSFSFDYFGTNLNYNLNPTGRYDHEFKNIKELYDHISNISFESEGNINNIDSHQYPGYKLAYCPNCISKINLVTGLNNIFSGQIEIFYNPIEIINDYTANKYLDINKENINTGDFIFFNNNLTGVIKYEKNFSSDDIYQIKRKI
jgi:TusA-related sulfurtransferase